MCRPGSFQEKEEKPKNQGDVGKKSLRPLYSFQKPGDEIQVKRKNDRYELFDTQKRLVGRLAKAFTPLDGLTFFRAEVIAVVERDRELTAPEFQSLIKCDKWEVILPELVYGTDGSNLENGT